MRRNLVCCLFAFVLFGMARPVLAADLLDKIRQQGTLTIGTSNDAPLSYIENGQPAGVLPDILREVPGPQWN